MVTKNNSNAPLPALLANPIFLLGATKRSQWPGDSGNEVAFAGRSNVGKSSAINCIMNRRKLARTSKTPGRTQQINFFDLSDSARIVDLPGYGFAKVPLKVRQQWELAIIDYLTNRESLVGLVLLMDSRHPLTELDQQMIAWCKKNAIRTHLLLTKSDKLSRNKAAQSLFKVNAIVNETENFSAQLFSSLNRDGLDEARSLLTDWLA
jgi:GTP-binding protein